MRQLRLGIGLQRAVLDGFAFPLGIVPGGIQVPTQGYTLAYKTPRDDESDT